MLIVTICFAIVYSKIDSHAYNPPPSSSTENNNKTDTKQDDKTDVDPEPTIPDIVLSSARDMVVSNANDMTLSIGVLNDNYNALFGEGSQYIVSVYLYDGETQYTLTKSREESMPYVSGSQSAGFNLIYALPSNFVISTFGGEYHTYKLQVKISNGSNVYLSNLLDYKRYYGDNATQYATYINTLQFNITL